MLVAPLRGMSIQRIAFLALSLALSLPALAGPAVSTGTGDERFTSACITENNADTVLDGLGSDLSDQEPMEGSMGPGWVMQSDSCEPRKRD